MNRLKFKECTNCKDWTGCMTDCFNTCAKPLDALEEFNRYRDLEEQGRLLKLPCVVGDAVYRISPHCNFFDQCQITGFAECDSVKSMCYTVYIDPDEKDTISLSDFGKTVFLTREEAEVALNETKGVHENAKN